MRKKEGRNNQSGLGYEKFDTAVRREEEHNCEKENWVKERTVPKG